MRGGWFMLRTIGTNISVITNFGCRAECWYCIWKGHHLENVQLKTDWKKLEDFLSSSRDKGKVSVSGGGDCLFLYFKYRDWWQRFLDLTKKYEMLVDVHTREKFCNDAFWKKINRCVFSSDRLAEDMDYLLYLVCLVDLRITHLVTEYTDFNLIQSYIDFCDHYGCQFTIKELVGFDDKGMYKKIRKKFPDVFYLDNGDYNIYYMPDNKIYTKFLQGEAQ